MNILGFGPLLAFMKDSVIINNLMNGSLSEQLMENRGRLDLLHIYEYYILFFPDLKHISV